VLYDPKLPFRDDRSERPKWVDSGHSMTSSARTRIRGGIVGPSAFAIFRLITSSKGRRLVDRQIGGLPPPSGSCRRSRPPAGEPPKGLLHRTAAAQRHSGAAARRGIVLSKSRPRETCGREIYSLYGQWKDGKPARLFRAPFRASRKDKERRTTIRQYALAPCLNAEMKNLPGSAGLKPDHSAVAYPRMSKACLKALLKPLMSDTFPNTLIKALHISDQLFCRSI
jgi:hypothetical protein